MATTESVADVWAEDMEQDGNEALEEERLRPDPPWYEQLVRH